METIEVDRELVENIIESFTRCIITHNDYNYLNKELYTCGHDWNRVIIRNPKRFNRILAKYLKYNQ